MNNMQLKKMKSKEQKKEDRYLTGITDAFVKIDAYMKLAFYVRPEIYRLIHERLLEAYKEVEKIVAEGKRIV